MKRTSFVKFRNQLQKLLILTVMALSVAGISAADAPKREFRGAWLHVVGAVSFRKMDSGEAKKFISDCLDRLADAGCNAVIFQVRPMADALYRSEIEDWSAYLTGRRGKAPSPLWDPMEYTIAEAHKRGMEFHAWLNPYRVTAPGESLPAGHLGKKEPHRFFRYNNQVFFDPAYQENRDLFANVVKDICSRYDVDAIHIDDYFYPYPSSSGGRFNGDASSYAKFGKGMDLDDWRRHNVDLLIEQVHDIIKKTKPWVRFGVSPFGIWRNRKNDPKGSDTNGLQNYDQLYADVLLWDRKGWVDYVVPQLYWELDHKAASSRKLIKWWNDNIVNAQLYIGQDVKRSMDHRDTAAGRSNELQTKVELSRQYPNVGGNVWWHGYWVTENYRGALTLLTDNLQRYLALPPSFGPDVKLDKPKDVRIDRRDGKVFIEWEAPERGRKEAADDIVKYAVYEFFEGEKVDISNAETLIAVTPFTSVELTGVGQDNERRVFAVTAIDRMNRESRPVEIKYRP